jgi:hypothetical protein
MPADIATPRWDGFLSEITCGNGELAAYIERLMALCITGLALHQLIIFLAEAATARGFCSGC